MGLFSRKEPASGSGRRSTQRSSVSSDAQVDELRASGSQVEVIVPGNDADYMLGASAMDLSARLPAAQTGYDQGKRIAGQIAALWR